MPSISKEDYLRAIYHLKEEEQEVKSVQVADYLNVSKPSVSEMIQHMDQDGLLQYKKYASIKLTTKGQKLARQLTARHRIIETFLQDMLKLEKSKVHQEAHKLEHAFSDDAIIKLQKLMKNPKQDPHGKPIPPLY